MGKGDIHSENRGFPKPDAWQGQNKRTLVALLPDPVQQIYTESHSALSSKLRVLTGIGIRAVVEAVCKHEAAAGKDLEKRIESLVEKGLIATEDGRVLHSLRFMGNQAAHEVKAHTEDELRCCLPCSRTPTAGCVRDSGEGEATPQKEKNAPKENHLKVGFSGHPLRVHAKSMGVPTGLLHNER